MFYGNLFEKFTSEQISLVNGKTRLRTIYLFGNKIANNGQKIKGIKRDRLLNGLQPLSNL